MTKTLKVVAGVAIGAFTSVGVWLLSQGKSPSDMDDVSNTNNLNPNPIYPLDLPYTPTNQPPTYTSPTNNYKQTGQPQSYNQPTQTYSYSNSQVDNLLQQVAILQQMVYIQTQINQIKPGTK